MMKTIIKIISLLSLLLLVALPVQAQSTGNVELLLSPATGPIYITSGTDIQIVVKPQGRDIVAFDFGLSYVGSDLVLSDGAPNASYDYFKTGNEGDWRITYTRQAGKPMPASDSDGKVVLGAVHLTPSASKQSGTVLVRIVAPAGYTAPLVTLIDNSQLPGNQVTAGSGTYDISAAPAAPTPTATPTPSPTPTPLPERPSITFPDSVGKNFEISSDPNSNRPEFRWNMMGNPAGGKIKRMGVRVAKASDNPNDTSGDFGMGCSNKVVLDRWWYSQTASDAQTHNRNQSDSQTNLKICSDGGEGYSISSEGKSADLLAQAFNLNNVTSYAYRPETPLSPGKYFMTVFNFDNTYHSDANTLGEGSDTSSASNFRSSYYFTVSCPASSPVWDNTGSRCISARTQLFALSEDINNLKDESTIQDKVLWWEYTEEPIPYTFSNPVPGQVRTLFVRFKDEKGNVNPPFNRPPTSKSIKYLGANPDISNVSCNFNSETGAGSKVTLTGSNFGGSQGKGKVTVTSSSGAANATITSWGKVVIQPSLSPTGVLGESVAEGTPAATPTGVVVAQTQDRVVVRVKERLEGTVNIELTVDDGRKVAASCAVDTNTVSFATQTQCRPAGSFAEDKVRVQIYEKTSNARPLYDSKVNPITIAADGTPQWTPPPLEIGKTYSLVIKAPKSLAVKREFTVLEGTNILDDIAFPVGDIAPINAPDGVINAVDKSELIRQWSATTDVARTGDFNIDGRINSLDYSCMRENINRAADQFIRN